MNPINIALVGLGHRGLNWLRYIEHNSTFIGSPHSAIR